MATHLNFVSRTSRDKNNLVPFHDLPDSLKVKIEGEMKQKMLYGW